MQSDKADAEIDRLTARVAELEALLAAKPPIDRASLYRITDIAPWTVIVINTAGRLDYANPAAARWMTLPAPATDQPVDVALSPTLLSAVRASIARAFTGKPHAGEISLADGAGAMRHLRLVVMPRSGGPDSVTGCVIQLHDVTESRAADLAIRENEARLRLVVNELNHRVKNTLAIVQGMARQTVVDGGDVRGAWRGFSERLVSLARAHDLITEESWTGADLATLVDRSVGAQAGAGRLRTAGPAVRLSPKLAVSLSLAFHELVTNAFKYGALSTPAGAIVLDWDLRPVDGAPWLRARWEETGGPPVAAPTRTGFGTRMLQQALASDLGGAVRMSYPKSGLVCEIEAPLGGAPA